MLQKLIANILRFSPQHDRITFKQLKALIITYVYENCTLREFKDCLTPKVYNIDEWGDELLINFVNEVKLNLAEYDSGCLSEIELRQLLRRMVLRKNFV